MRRPGGRVPLVLLWLATALAAEGETPVSSAGPPAPAGPAPRGYVTGTVRAADGTPIARVAVRPRSLDHPARAIPELVVATDERGTYRWSLPPGRYELSVEPVEPVEPGAVRRAAVISGPVTVVAGRTVAVDLTID